MKTVLLALVGLFAVSAVAQARVTPAHGRHVIVLQPVVVSESRLKAPLAEAAPAPTPVAAPEGKFVEVPKAAIDFVALTTHR